MVERSADTPTGIGSSPTVGSRQAPSISGSRRRSPGWTVRSSMTLSGSLGVTVTRVAPRLVRERRPAARSPLRRSSRGSPAGRPRRAARRPATRRRPGRRLGEFDGAGRGRDGWPRSRPDPGLARRRVAATAPPLERRGNEDGDDEARDRAGGRIGRSHRSRSSLVAVERHTAGRRAPPTPPRRAPVPLVQRLGRPRWRRRGPARLESVRRRAIGTR